MFIPTAFLVLIAVASAIPAPLNEIPACSNDRAGIALKEFNNYSFQACAHLFEHGALKGPAQNTTHILRGTKTPGDGSEDKEKKYLYLKITWKLVENVSTMGLGACEYAFTNKEAYEYNADKGNVCSTASTREMYIMAWEFQREGRKYVAELANEERPFRNDVSGQQGSFWE